jgi:hypothetical protein
MPDGNGYEYDFSVSQVAGRGRRRTGAPRRSETRPREAGAQARLPSPNAWAPVRDVTPAAQAAQRELARLHRWLLIFDNARDPSSVRLFWPATATGRVLVTSRYTRWRGVARGLLEFAAFPARERIPRRLLAAAPGLDDELALNPALKDLHAWPLADFADGGIAVHRLVALAVRSRLAEAEQQRQVEETVVVLSRVFRFDVNDLTGDDPTGQGRPPRRRGAHPPRLGDHAPHFPQFAPPPTPVLP